MATMHFFERWFLSSHTAIFFLLSMGSHREVYTWVDSGNVLITWGTTGVVCLYGLIDCAALFNNIIQGCFLFVLCTVWQPMVAIEQNKGAVQIWTQCISQKLVEWHSVMNRIDEEIWLGGRYTCQSEIDRSVNAPICCKKLCELIFTSVIILQSVFCDYLPRICCACHEVRKLPQHSSVFGWDIGLCLRRAFHGRHHKKNKRCWPHHVQQAMVLEQGVPQCGGEIKIVVMTSENCSIMLQYSNATTQTDENGTGVADCVWRHRLSYHVNDSEIERL